MKKQNDSQIIELPIDTFGRHGEGVGTWKNRLVYVNDALPGEKVQVQLSAVRQSYAHGKLMTVVKSSPERVTPPCPLFGHCGGCQLMHLGDQHQLRVKRERVVRAFEAYASLKQVVIEACRASPQPLHYRNKIQLPVERCGAAGWKIGLYARDSHELVDIERCTVHCAVGEDVYRRVRMELLRSNIVPYDPVARTGELRTLLIKSAIHTQEVLVVLVVTQISEALRTFAQTLLNACPSVKGVVANVNQRASNTLLGETFYVLAGSETIREQVNGLQFHLSVASFFQVNTEQAELLYQAAIDLAKIQPHHRVVDAYCGIGTLTLQAARLAKEVVGIESVSEAIEDARKNAALNNLTNTVFHCAKVEDHVEELRRDVIFLNPPRKGCDARVLEAIGLASPARVVYISCDPDTLARDLAHLVRFGYTVDIVIPFDMFPQTAHVETLVQLSKS